MLNRFALLSILLLCLLFTSIAKKKFFGSLVPGSISDTGSGNDGDEPIKTHIVSDVDIASNENENGTDETESAPSATASRALASVLMQHDINDDKVAQYFLPSVYKCQDSEDEYFLIRHVPGDGACLFHALAIGLDHLSTKTHLPFTRATRMASSKLRELAVQLLRKENELLFIENGEMTTSAQLVEVVSSHYNMSPKQYCNEMEKAETWGGGPEIVVLCNYLKRPIHVYMLAERLDTKLDISNQMYCNEQTHCLTIRGKFGSPDFDSNEPLRILCADGRFPDCDTKVINEWIETKIPGDHFFTLFPCKSM